MLLLTGGLAVSRECARISLDSTDRQLLPAAGACGPDSQQQVSSLCCVRSRESGWAGGRVCGLRDGSTDKYTLWQSPGCACVS